MSNKQQIRRAFVLLAFFFTAFACLGWRLVDLQVLNHSSLLAAAERKTERKIWQPAKRGDILDANGNPLATSLPVKTVWVNPEVFAAQKLVHESFQAWESVLRKLGLIQ